MDRNAISNLRLSNQQIINSKFDNPIELLEWMGAVQAQDLPMAMLAIAMRVRNATVKNIEQAFNDGQLIRTHLMRPNWHIVSKNDIYWMLDLTTAQIKRTIGRRHQELELSREILRKANRLLEKHLSNKELSKEELKSIFHSNNIPTNENRLSHLLVNAEMEQLICNGRMDGRIQSYALLAEKVPEKRLLSREESIYTKTDRTFLS
ncbi:MAG: DNA glycosylase AlkZ-like family protein [Paludibacteraceae bacterium]